MWRLRTLILWILVTFAKELKTKKLPNKPLHILPGNLVPRLDYINDCPNVSMPFTITRTSLRTLASKYVVMDADFDTTREIQLKQIIVVIYNCDDSASGNCPVFQTWRFGKDSCKMITMPNQLWSPFIQNFTPRLACINHPGHYTLRNGSFEMGILQKLPFPLEKYYWKTQVEVVDPSLAICMRGGWQRWCEVIGNVWGGRAFEEIPRVRQIEQQSDPRTISYTSAETLNRSIMLHNYNYLLNKLNCQK